MNNNTNNSVNTNNDSPDLTHLWNKASLLAQKKIISIYTMNDIWEALRTLEKHKFCKLATSSYD